MRVYILPRVHKRHPELTDEDVLTAFHSIMIDARRDNETWVCIGLDSRGRNVEIVYKQIGEDVLIYHAMTPPTKKIKIELAKRRY